MFTVTVRDHMMIAHSLRGTVFGPAQRLHGATYVVAVEFAREDLDADGIVVDIGAASAALKQVLSEFRYHNLDEVPSLAGVNTTTERLARIIFERMAAQIGAGRLGETARGVSAMKVTLSETPTAEAAYGGPMPSTGGQ
ncbi:MAG: 6-carboxytetrahydropterin synthase [Rhodospirillales bacterium]